MRIDYSDLESLLDVAGDSSPCGPNLEYEPLFLELERDSKGRPALEFGTYRVDAERPDWWRLSQLARGLLAQSKDLRTGVYFVRALVATEGLPGLARGLYVLNRLVRDRWGCVHPQLEDGDATWRLNAIAALSDAAGLLKELQDVDVWTPQGSTTVRELITLKKAGPDQRFQVPDNLIMRAAWRDEHLRAAVDSAHHWVDELRDALVERLGSNGAAPLQQLADMIGDLGGWSAARVRQADADGQPASAERWVGGAGPEVELIPPEEFPGPLGPATTFKVYRPIAVKPGTWTSFLVYLHNGDRATVEADSAQRLGASRAAYASDEDVSRVSIARGAEVTVIPAIPGCRFNPRQQRIEWLEDVQTVEFRCQASPDVAGYTTERRLRGHVRVYVGPLLIGEIPTSIAAVEDVEFLEPLPVEGAVAHPFSRVFVSYAHDDARIVSRLEQAYALVRIDYLRDVNVLRVGDRWHARILDEIGRADRFQLCWSAAASRSEYVEREWRHALTVQHEKQEAFICPFYWQTPMPSPPAELADLHFAYLDLGSA